MDYKILSREMLQKQRSGSLVPTETPKLYKDYEKRMDEEGSDDYPAYFAYIPYDRGGVSLLKSIPSQVYANKDYVLWPGMLKVKSRSYMQKLSYDGVIDYYNDSIYVPAGLTITTVLAEDSKRETCDEYYLMERCTYMGGMASVERVYSLLESFPSKEKVSIINFSVNKPMDIEEMYNLVREYVKGIPNREGYDITDIMGDIGFDDLLKDAFDITTAIKRFNKSLENYVEKHKKMHGGW